MSDTAAVRADCPCPYCRWARGEIVPPVLPPPVAVPAAEEAEEEK